MRFIAIIKLNYIVTDEILRAFCGSLAEPNETKSLSLFKDALKALRSRVARLPDRRSREIFEDAIGWALSYPAEIEFHVKKHSGLAHLPNMTAFPPILQETDGREEAWETDVKVIKHYRESQIQAPPNTIGIRCYRTRAEGPSHLSESSLNLALCLGVNSRYSARHTVPVFN
jgi:hypothetical protein